MKVRDLSSRKQPSASYSLIDDSKNLEASDCIEHGFPICLEKGLLELYGPKGKKVLDSIVLNETFQSAELTSSIDLAKFNDEYLDRLSGILGNNVCRVIGLATLSLMRNYSCKNCPLAGSANSHCLTSKSLEPITNSMFVTGS